MASKEHREALQREVEGYTEHGPVARSPYFTPRLLGATAPHDPTLWRLDFRDPCDDSVQPEDFDPPLRSFSDPGLLDELDLLLQAGLRVTSHNQEVFDLPSLDELDLFLQASLRVRQPNQ